MNKLNTILLLSFMIVFSGTIQAKTSSDSLNRVQKTDYLTIDQAVKILKLSNAALPYQMPPDSIPEMPDFFKPPYKPIEPVKLFDQLYFVGTASVCAFVLDTGDGLVMFDTGCGDEEIALMVADMKKLGLNPSMIKLILLSHEHFDHYGGVQYLKRNVCPDAKVAMSLTGWNLLQTVPYEWAYIGTRPQSVDIFLTDGMKIKVGNTVFQMVATPGHSPGCMSFIFPVTDKGENHMVGLMGGSAVFPTQVETQLYKSSVEYFKAFAVNAKCDIGLYFHSQESDFTALRVRKDGEPNPMIMGTEKFNSIYLQSFRERYYQMLKSGNLKSY